MSSNTEIELFKQFKAAQEKYSYFLLAVAASAIGFAITQTKLEALALSHIILGFSILFWSLSFYAGLQFIEFTISITFTNHNHLALQRDISKYAKGERMVELNNQANRLLNKTTSKQELRMKIYGKLQSCCLLLGAVFYIGWHTLSMYQLST